MGKRYLLQEEAQGGRLLGIISYHCRHLSHTGEVLQAGEVTTSKLHQYRQHLMSFLPADSLIKNM